MGAPPSKGPSVTLPVAPSWAHLRLSIFPASRQSEALSCETEVPRIMFRVCTIYLVVCRGFIGVRGMMGLTGKQTGAAAALIMSGMER
jgi:hypothetical protein